MKVTITYQDERGTEVRIARELDVDEHSVRTNGPGGHDSVKRARITVSGDRTHMDGDPYRDENDPFDTAQVDLAVAATIALLEALGFDTKNLFPRGVVGGDDG